MNHRKSGRPAGPSRTAPAATAAARALPAALTAHSQGRLADAEVVYRQILAAEPAHIDANNLLGTLLHQTGRNEEALPHLQRAVAAKPDFADAQSNLGMVLQALGQVDAARRAFDAAIALNPGHWSALGMRASVFAGQARWAEARADFERALQGLPGWADGWCKLAAACRQLDDPPSAAQALQTASALRPGDAEILRDLGICLRDLGDLAGSRHALERAVAIAPGQARMSCQLAWTLRDQGHLVDARAWFERSLSEAGPEANRLDALIGLGTVLGMIGLPDLALDALSEARRMDPTVPSLRSPELASLIYSPTVGKDQRLARHRAWGAVLDALARPGFSGVRPAPPWRVGFLSAELRNHAVARFLLSWLGRRDRARFEFFAYADIAAEDQVSAELRQHFDGWRIIHRQSDAAVAETLRVDALDIVVELSGHSTPNRLAALGLGVAPIAASWLGYPETTGLRSVDYRITDARCDPPGEEAFATERLARLAGGFLCYAPSVEEAAAEPAEPERREFVFGCFNNLSKINPRVIETFARILRQVPTASLVLKHFALNDPQLREAVAGRFAGFGIAPAQVVLLAAEASQRAHLECYNRIDLTLDSFPYNGTTTSCESLWMGVPVLGLEGERHAGRVGESLLAQVFGPEAGTWLARGLDDYVARAVAAAARGPRTRAARLALRSRVEASSLMDGASFARRLEGEFERWIRARLDGATR